MVNSYPAGGGGGGGGVFNKHCLLSLFSFYLFLFFFFIYFLTISEMTFVLKKKLPLLPHIT